VGDGHGDGANPGLVALTYDLSVIAGLRIRAWNPWMQRRISAISCYSRRLAAEPEYLNVKLDNSFSGP